MMLEEESWSLLTVQIISNHQVCGPTREHVGLDTRLAE